MKQKKSIAVLCAVLLLAVLCTQTAFAAKGGNLRTRSAAWLQNPQNTGFDFTETDYPDSILDWTMFTLARDNREIPAEYPAYMEKTLDNAFSALYPADFARMALSAAACGLDPRQIGAHDLLAALETPDYSAQIYLSSLVYPLLAMHFRSDFHFAQETRQTIVDTILRAQQPDGGWSYCSVDTGYGIVTDPDSTAMALQALAPYREQAAVQAAAEQGFAYLKTQQGETGAVLSFGAPSAESTAQYILALCAWGKQPDADAYAVNGITLLEALCGFLNESGGARNFQNAEDPLTTYQVLQALTAADRLHNGKAGLFTYDKDEAEQTTAPTAESTETTVEQGQQDITDSVDIPKTAGETVGFAAGLAAAAAGVLLTRRKYA